MADDATQRTNWRSLARAALLGDYADWRRACEQAKRDGWTLQQVEVVLLLVANPMLWIGVATLLISVGIAMHG